MNNIDNEKKLEKLHKEYQTRDEKLEDELSNIKKKLKNLEEKQEDTFHLKQNILSFWNKIMEAQNEGGYGIEMRKLENTQEELISTFRKIEDDFNDEHEKLELNKSKLIEDKDNYSREYKKKVNELKETK